MRKSIDESLVHRIIVCADDQAKYVPLDTANGQDGFGREDGSSEGLVGGDDDDNDMSAI